MTAFLIEWLNLLLRWGHMIAGIAWIGTSFYFIALDFSLRKQGDLPSGVAGEAWEVHGGGFYRIHKYLTAPEALPPHLTWFKWEAYLTWVTGFLLLIAQYYLNAAAYLIDPSIADLTVLQAILISLATIAAGWIVYNALCKHYAATNPTLLAGLVFALILAAAYGYTHVYSGRGALIHVGVFIGTIMAANVFMVIIPNQRKIVTALLRGEKPDPAFGITGKQRSLHNTYLTLPVLALMISNHFAMITDHGQAWILVGLIVVGGAAARHFLVRHEVGDPLAKIAWTLPLVFAAFAIAYAMTWQGAASWAPLSTDWANFILRWAHMVAGTAWIGTSFYFIALDFSLRKHGGLPAGVAGEAWEVHGGGFYNVHKYLTAPSQLPQHLIWFKWEAYLTWVSGFALLIVLYYLNAETYLIDNSVRELTKWQAIGMSAASLLAGWAIYDALCRSPLGHNAAALGLIVYSLILVAAYAYTHTFSGRGALIHVGALIGTIMAANVFMVIIPNQRRITAALLKDETPDPRLGAVGKQRSLHNTYLTLPVLLMMVSNHYPMITDHPQSWLLVGLIVLGGASLRYWLVRVEVGDRQEDIAWSLPLIGGALGLALTITQPAERMNVGDVSDDVALSIVRQRCAGCHAAQPTHKGFSKPPKGVVMETIADLKRYAQAIETQAVNGRAMPLGNVTKITAEERAKLGAWIGKL